MAIGWFICPYITENNPGGWPYYHRRPPFLDIVHADGGAWAASEGLGNHVVAKVRASDGALASIAALPNVVRIPNKTVLSQSLSDLTVAQRNTLTNKLQAIGYSLTEIRAQLGNDIRSKTLGDVLRFVLRRRLTPRFDTAQGIMVLDGAERPTKSIEAVNSEVAEN